MKVDITVDDLLDEENISTAIEFLKTKKNTCGDDGVWLHELDGFWKINRDRISKEIKQGNYIPQIVHEKILIMANGKHRKIALMSSVDRMLLRAILKTLQEALESTFSEHSYAYQCGKGIDKAVKCVAEYIESGYDYVVEIDLKDFFEKINHGILLKILKEYITDNSFYALLERYIVCRIETDYQLVQKSEGLLQGSPMSPLLSNLYLTEFDKWMEEKEYVFARFADNINVYVKDLQEGYLVLSQIKEKLQEYFLEINTEKSGVFSVFSRKYLGYIFEKVGSSVIVKKYRTKELHVFSKWHKEAIEKIDSNYYIINDGILTKKNFTILFQNDEKKAYIPVETTDSINIYSNIELNSDFLQLLNQRNLNLNIYDRYGVYIGSFYSNNQKNRMKCLIKQVEIYKEDKLRFEYAKKIEIASVYNLRCNLKYYNKQRPTEILKENIDKLTEGIRQMNEAKNVDDLLIIEARCRQNYYLCFNEMIQDEDFIFVRRSKRPPKDAINAMISFGNVFMYQKIAQMIYKSNIDIRISFVHSALKRYENLNLDLADIFKPVIVDRVICTLINKKMISGKRHFQKEEDIEGTFLNKEGKNIFIREMEWKLKQVLTVNGQQYTYERLINREVRNLERNLLNGEKYVPFKYQM